MKYESEIPKSASVLKLSKNLQGVIELGENANFKFVHCSMYFIVGGRRFVKHIAFAWLFGNPDLYLKIDPTISAEEDFYSFLFSELQAIATRGFGVISPNLRKKTFDMYLSLLETVHEKFEKHIANTQADENESQFLLTRYKFFLEPTATLIESQISLVSTVTRKPDFHIQLSGQRHIYVEIEPPHYKPFSNQTKTARFEGALAQIVEWRAILKETEEEIKYLIIIGYDDDMNEAEKRALVSFNESQTDLRVITWNWILSSIEDFVGRLKRSLSEAP